MPRPAVRWNRDKHRVGQPQIWMRRVLLPTSRLALVALLHLERLVREAMAIRRSHRRWSSTAFAALVSGDSESDARAALPGVTHQDNAAFLLAGVFGYHGVSLRRCHIRHRARRLDGSTGRIRVHEC